MKFADNRALAAEKKFYIQPNTQYQSTCFTSSICVNSVKGPLDFGGTADPDDEVL